eukprot:EG_transcript_26159
MAFTVNVVCQSNVNRSMAAHQRLLQCEGITVVSSGVGEKVKVPGPALDKPNVFDFGGPTYEQMESDFRRADERLYTHNNLISMMARNKTVKPCPERFADVWAAVPCHVVFSFEERVFDYIVEWIQISESHPPPLERTHVFNLNVRDNKDEADRGADLCVQFIQLLLATPDWENRVPELLLRFERDTGRALLHCLLVLPDTAAAAGRGGA